MGPEKAQLQPSPVVATAVIAKLPAACVEAFIKLHHRSTIIIHPDGIYTWLGGELSFIFRTWDTLMTKLTRASQVHDAHDKKSLDDWEFMFISSWSQEEAVHLEGDEILKDLKRRGETFSEPFRSFFRGIPDGTKSWHSRLSYWEPVPWDNRGGLVTLAGDAAHSMTFRKRTASPLPRTFCLAL